MAGLKCIGVLQFCNSLPDALTLGRGYKTSSKDSYLDVDLYILPKESAASYVYASAHDGLPASLALHDVGSLALCGC